MEAAFVLLGAAISLVASLVAEMYKKHGRRDEQHNDLYRIASGNFVGLSIAARYEYERLAKLRCHDWATPIPGSLLVADADVARAYNQLSLIASSDAFDKATHLRKRLEDMRAWVVEGDPSKLTEVEIKSCASEIWVLRNDFVEDVRSELGHEGHLNWGAGPGR